MLFPSSCTNTGMWYGPNVIETFIIRMDIEQRMSDRYEDMKRREKAVREQKRGTWTSGAQQERGREKEEKSGRWGVSRDRERAKEMRGWEKKKQKMWRIIRAAIRGKENNEENKILKPKGPLNSSITIFSHTLSHLHTVITCMVFTRNSVHAHTRTHTHTRACYLTNKHEAVFAGVYCTFIRTQ